MTDKAEMEEVLAFYNAGAEKGRLERGIGQLEWARTREIIENYLPQERQVIFDLGGGIGVYSRWLAGMGHEVHMFELAPTNVEYANSLQQGLEFPIHKIEQADARKLDRPCESADIVLLMGPLYHLTEKTERIKAIREAARVLKRGGLVIATAISRFSSTLWGLSVFGERNDFVEEDHFFAMIEQEVSTGQHIRPEQYPGFIARAYFHLPSELKAELEAAGLSHEATVSIEGPVWMVPAFEEKWNRAESRERLLTISRWVERQESLIGLSPHILAVARKL